MPWRRLLALGVCLLAAVSCAPEGGAPGSGADDPPAPVALGSADVLAGRLTRLLWDLEGDPAISARLTAQPLTRGVVAEVARSMLEDRRSRQGVAAFYRWWLLLDLLPDLPKEDPQQVLDPPLRASMAEEAPALGVHLTLEAAGTLPELLTSPFTFADERLARHYGLTGVTGPELRKVSYPPGEPRSGLLAGAGVLSVFSSLSNPSWPAKRGWLVTDQLLCTPIARTFLPPVTPDPQRSLREQMITMTAPGSCMGCHRILNSPGFGLIGFDSFGRWRPEPGHQPGETAGWIPAQIMPDEPPFAGARELAALLSARPEVSRCFTRQWLQYALDRGGVVRDPVPPAWVASLDRVVGRFEASGLSLRELILAVTASDAFLGP